MATLFKLYIESKEFNHQFDSYNLVKINMSIFNVLFNLVYVLTYCKTSH